MQRFPLDKSIFVHVTPWMRCEIMGSDYCMTPGQEPPALHLTYTVGPVIVDKFKVSELLTEYGVKMLALARGKQLLQNGIEHAKTESSRLTFQ